MQTNIITEEFDVKQVDDYYVGAFRAMASPCAILIDTKDRDTACEATRIAYTEAKRIELKFSRYREDNIVYRINNANGAPVTVDDETALLLDYAALCYELSEGRFDITSGVLRRVWRFDQSDKVPSEIAVAELLVNVGWQKVRWQRPVLQLKPGMEIDFGGIGKEYAVDRSALLVHQCGIRHALINYGGDLLAIGPRANGEAWRVGVENPQFSENLNSRHDLRLERGALATSGDSQRYCLKNGVRYSHILDPHTGWSVPDSPRSVTVHAATCLEAGMLASFAMLLGKGAQKFLKKQANKFWIVP